MKMSAQAEALGRLRKLVEDLNRGYAKAAAAVTEKLRPLEEIVQQIDETWLPVHTPDRLLANPKDGAHRPPACFAHETFASGDEAEYVLCVARNEDRNCGLYASVCMYRLGQAAGSGGDKAVVRGTRLLPLASLPVPLRVRALDVLDEFAAEYEKHVRKVREGLLARLADQATQPAADPPPPQAEKAPAESRPPEPAPKAAATQPRAQEPPKQARGPRVPDVSIPLKDFALTVVRLRNTVYQVPLIQCTRCGTVVGVEQYDLVERIERQVRELDAKFRVLLDALQSAPAQATASQRPAQETPTSGS